MNRAIAYIRVSTEEQSESGVSLEAQEAKIRTYCSLYDIEMVDVVKDAGVSAKSLKRPGLQSALKRLKKKEADGILIAKLDRLSRNVRDWNALIDDYFGERAGFQLWSVADKIDTTTATGRMMLNIVMTVAQWEREVISERTVEALQHKKACGERISGRLPYGYQLAADGVALEPCRSEQDVLALMRDLRASGLTLAAIAQELNVRGIHRREGSEWEPTYVYRLLGKKAA